MLHPTPFFEECSCQVQMCVVYVTQNLQERFTDGQDF